MDRKYSYGLNQLIALASLIILSPALRLFPAAAAATAGHAAWVSPFLAFPPILLLLFFLCRVMEKREDGEGLAELILRKTGPVAGRIFLIITALWLLLYGGFSLRAGTNRLITTIYPNASPLFFTVTMGLLGLIAALGSLRALVRFAKIILPAVFGILLLVLLFALFSIDASNLSPVTAYDLQQIALGALPAVNVVVFTLYCVCFSEGLAEQKPERFRRFAIWSAAMLLLLFLLSAAIIGNFGG